MNPRSPEHEALYASTVAFARKLDQAPPEDEAFPRALWKRCAEHGLLGLMMPPEYGGSGGDAVGCVTAYEAFGYGCRDNGLAFGLAGQLLSCQMPILQFASPAVRERYLPGLISGELIAAHGSSEPDAGSDVNRVRTVARAVDGGFVLTGSKIYSTLGPVSDLAIVLARMGDEKGRLSEFVVPREAYRVSKPLKKIGLSSAVMSELFFEDAFVPADHLLGHSGSGLFGFMSTMEWERLCILASNLGAMERQLEACVAHARSRSQFSVPIGNFQAVAHRIAEMKLRLETSRLLLYDAARKKASGGRATLESALVKLHLSESRHANALDAVRIFGAYGCMEEGGVEGELRDAVPGLIYSGTSDIQRNTIARLLGLLSGPGDGLD